MVWKEQRVGAAAPRRPTFGDLFGHRGQGPQTAPPLLFERWQEVVQRLESQRPVFFLDYDGTLAWIASRPELAKLPMAARISLERLSQRWPVHVLSGRSRADVEEMIPISGCRFQGDHGFELDVPTPLVLRKIDRRPLDLLEASLAETVGKLRGVFFERKAYTLAVHHRLAEPGAESRIRRAIYELLPSFPGWSVEPGRRVFEIRPSLVWGKGQAIDYLLAESKDSEGVLPVVVGDDDTDESAFRTLGQRALTIHVSAFARPSSAQYRVKNPTDVHRFLDRVLEEVAVPDPER